MVEIFIYFTCTNFEPGSQYNFQMIIYLLKIVFTVAIFHLLNQKHFTRTFLVYCIYFDAHYLQLLHYPLILGHPIIKVAAPNNKKDEK